MLQDKSKEMVGVSRKMLLVLVPIIFVMIVYVSWLTFR